MPRSTDELRAELDNTEQSIFELYGHRTARKLPGYSLVTVEHGILDHIDRLRSDLDQLAADFRKLKDEVHEPLGD